MIKKLKIAAVITLASCFFNLATTSLLSPVHAAGQKTFLADMSADLSDLTVVTGINDLDNDLSEVSDNLTPWPLTTFTTKPSTAVNKLWINSMWIKTWMWSKLR